MKAPLRILAGGVVRQSPDVLEAHLHTVKAQSSSAAVTLAFLDDNDDPASQALIKDWCLEVDGKPDNARYEVTSYSHHWSLETLLWLARQRQKLLDVAREGSYDALFIVDSDLLLAPDVLASLIGTGKDIVSGVFWTAWEKGTRHLPQVWLSHPYGLSDGRWQEHEFLAQLASRQLLEVNGLGACTLIRSQVFDRVAYWPPIEGLPDAGMWQGEDRHFSIRAARNGLRMWADAWPDIWHCYTPEHRVEIQGRVHRLNSVCRTEPRFGDAVSFTVEPLEEPQLAEYTAHVRGRLGQLRLLPELEAELLQMRVGDSRLLRLTFPAWHPIPHYQNRTRVVRLTLLAAREHHPPPGSYIDRDLP